MVGNFFLMSRNPFCISIHDDIENKPYYYIYNINVYNLYVRRFYSKIFKIPEYSHQSNILGRMHCNNSSFNVSYI